jgi:NAD kinase
MFPHTLSARPLVINGSSTIRLRFSHRRNDLEISCDSQIALPIQEGEDVNPPLRLPPESDPPKRLQLFQYIKL